jgi:hypothetical protein
MSASRGRLLGGLNGWKAGRAEVGGGGRKLATDIITSGCEEWALASENGSQGLPKFVWQQGDT